MPGPAPKPASAVRRPGQGLGARALTRLPRSGRVGDPPAWPFVRQTQRERVIWARLWATPQAVAWEQIGFVDAVARYCMLTAKIEARKAKAIELIEARQLEDRLGLNHRALLTLRWDIVDDTGDADDAKVVDIRSRMAEDPA